MSLPRETTYKSLLQLLKEEENKAEMTKELDKTVHSFQQQIQTLMPKTYVCAEKKHKAGHKKKKVVSSAMSDPNFASKPKAVQQLLLRQANKQVTAKSRLQEETKRSGLEALYHSPFFPLVEKQLDICERMKDISNSLPIEQRNQQDVIDFASAYMEVSSLLLNPDTDAAQVKDKLNDLHQRTLTLAVEYETVSGKFKDLGRVFKAMGLAVDVISAKQKSVLSP